MKMRLDAIFDSLSEKELDILLGDGAQISLPAESSAETIEGLTAERVALSVKNRQRKRRGRSILLIAASFVLLLAASLGMYACTEEVKEYNRAIEFFDNTSLPTDGLSRSEIKSVWHDIADGSFSNPKTAEILIEAIKESGISGNAIFGADMTPNAVRKLYWKWCDFLINGYEDEAGHIVRFDIEIEYGKEVRDPDIVYLVKYENDVPVWKVLCDGMEYAESHLVGDHVLVYGSPHKLICFSAANGESMWSHTFDLGINERVESIIGNGNSAFTAFTKGNRREKVDGVTVKTSWFGVTKFDFNGNILSRTLTDVTNFGQIDVIEKYGGGFILNANGDDETIQEFVRLDSEGNFVQKMEYAVNRRDELRVSDIIEYSGKIYVSAYYYPLKAAAKWSNWKEENVYVTNTEQTPEILDLIEDRYVAILVIIDLDKETGEIIRSVSGALGAELNVSEKGQLLWDVKVVKGAQYMPFYSGRPPLCVFVNVYRYCFGSTGSLIDIYDTGYSTLFDDH